MLCHYKPVLPRQDVAPRPLRDWARDRRSVQDLLGVQALHVDVHAPVVELPLPALLLLTRQLEAPARARLPDLCA
jgi:hypothetical protein